MQALLLLALGTCPPADEPREVLCLWDSTEREEVRHGEIHVYAETALNYLGLLAVYHDVNSRPLPDDRAMSRYRGVLTWFTDRSMSHARDYWTWLGRQAEAGRKVVILGELGATTAVPPEDVNRGLRPLGLTYLGRETDDPTVMKVLSKNGAMVEFERGLDRELRSYVQVRADPGLAVHLRLGRTDLADGDSDVVVTGPRGGFAWVTMHYDPVVVRDQWRLNPFDFFAEAFGLQGVPRPDLATAQGRRILFVSIDGDGVGNRVQPGPKTGRLAGEVVRDDFIKALDLPFTVSVIAADLEEHRALARSLLELPNVEAAAHGYYHPLVWSRRTLAFPGEFSLEREIDDAVRAVQEVSPRPVKMYLWTGDCDPPPEAIDRVDRLGLANLNGWDPGRFQNYDAVSNMRSTISPRDGRIQFNNRAMSENHFTDLWTRNFFAYRNVLRTYAAGGSPRRITPIHVYFHFYVVEQPAGEAALREIFTWALGQDIHPMTATDYVTWVKGFLSARLERLPGGAWKVSSYGACRTVRFDDVPSFPDLARSKNVLGFKREGRALYVHLGPGSEAVVALGPAAPTVPYLVDANGAWEDGRIVAKTAARAVVMTPGGARRLESPGPQLELPFK